MQTKTIWFTNYRSSELNRELTYSTGIVGISQASISVNDVVYICFIYDERSFITGRIQVSRIVPVCKWPEENDFKTHCQSNQNVEYCTPIDAEQMSFQVLCNIQHHLTEESPVIDELTIKRIGNEFERNLLEPGIKPSFAAKHEEIRAKAKSFSLREYFTKWLYAEPVTEELK